MNSPEVSTLDLERIAEGSDLYGACARDAKLLRLNTVDREAAACAAYIEEISVASGWHYHDMHQLSLAFDGAIELETEAGLYMVPCQIAAWIPAGVPHRMRLHRERSASVWFPREMVADDEARVRTLLTSPLMREMTREAVRWSVFSPPSIIRTNFFRAMASLCSEWICNEADLFVPSAFDPRLRRALEEVASDRGATLHDVCRHAGMSERSFRRLIKSETGLTWGEYRHRVRILQAIHLLRETRMSIGEIATHCGFEDASWFSKTFRTTVGELPRDYRDRSRRA